MIRRLLVSNFRSLGPAVDLRLGRLTALVGQNGSGKSNVADVLQFLSDCMHIGLEGAVTKRHGIQAIRRFQATGHPHDITIHVELELEGGSAEYDLVLAGDAKAEYRVKRERAMVEQKAVRYELEVEGGRWQRGPEGLKPKVDALGLALPLIAGDERFASLGQELRSAAVYSIFPDTLREPQKYDPSRPMDRHGGNWVSILKDQDEGGWKPDLVEVLGRLTGDICDVRVRQIAGFLTVELKHEQQATKSAREKWFNAAQESDGTLRVAGMITALLQRPRPSMVALEEPELTVHPGALRLLHEYVTEAAGTGQVLLTTHSPELLTLLDVGDVRVVQRVGGATTVSELAESQRDVVRQGLYSLGEVLLTEGLQPEAEHRSGG